MFKAINKMKVREDKGFTLVELLIVVAIIGILAAIAIPQFSQYRIRGYNSAANSDLRNMKIASEAFVTDWQVYASTIGCTAIGGTGCTGDDGTGAIITGPGNAVINVLANGITITAPSAAARLSFGLSSGVSGVITTTTDTAADYTAYTSHKQGDTVYGADSNLTQIKQAGKDAAGVVIPLLNKVAGGTLSSTPASTNADDLSTANWANM